MYIDCQECRGLGCVRCNWTGEVIDHNEAHAISDMIDDSKDVEQIETY